MSLRSELAALRRQLMRDNPPRDRLVYVVLDDQANVVAGNDAEAVAPYVGRTASEAGLPGRVKVYAGFDPAEV